MTQPGRPLYNVDQALQYLTPRRSDSIRSYSAYVTASRGSLLLGGVKHHESSRFETSEQASLWIQAILEGNGKAGRSVAAWGTNTHDLAPEIPA